MYSLVHLYVGALLISSFSFLSFSSTSSIEILTLYDPARLTNTTIRQRRHREKMKSQELSLVQVWVPDDRIIELRAIAARMKAESSEDYEPTGRQLAFAQFLCDIKGLRLEQEHLSSTRKLSRWIRQNRKKPNKFRS